MNPKQRKRASKFLSLVLRHQPEAANVVLDEHGWVDVRDLLPVLIDRGLLRDFDDLAEVVETSDKKRFALSEDGTRIRANQGHSVTVDLGFEEATPPDVLYHGTPKRNVGSIWNSGLLRGDRHHVHLSADVETARHVGARRGTPAIFIIDARRMVQEGFLFYCSENGVWLTEHVPPEYLEEHRL